jgi:hypothetical protein
MPFYFLLEQQRGELDVPVSRGPVEGRPSVLISRIHIAPLLEQERGELDVPVCRGPVEGRPSVSISRVHIGPMLEQ